MLGVAAVAVHIDGLKIEHGDGTGEMELYGLPFQGSVRIGKKGGFYGFSAPSRPLHQDDFR